MKTTYRRNWKHQNPNIENQIRYRKLQRPNWIKVAVFLERAIPECREVCSALETGQEVGRDIPKSNYHYCCQNYPVEPAMAVGCEDPSVHEEGAELGANESIEIEEVVS